MYKGHAIKAFNSFPVKGFPSFSLMIQIVISIFSPSTSSSFFAYKFVFLQIFFEFLFGQNI
jgi:hypothetical protein